MESDLRSPRSYGNCFCSRETPVYLIRRPRIIRPTATLEPSGIPICIILDNFIPFLRPLKQVMFIFPSLIFHFIFLKLYLHSEHVQLFRSAIIMYLGRRYLFRPVVSFDPLITATSLTRPNFHDPFNGVLLPRWCSATFEQLFAVLATLSKFCMPF